jgi:hypothetical protein
MLPDVSCNGLVKDVASLSRLRKALVNLVEPKWGIRDQVKAIVRHWKVGRQTIRIRLGHQDMTPPKLRVYKLRDILLVFSN